MDIALMSMELSSVKVQQNVGISMLKKTMESQEAQVSGLIEMLDTASPQNVPSDGIGQLVDVMA